MLKVLWHRLRDRITHARGMNSMAGALGISRARHGVFVVIPTELLNRLPRSESRAAFRLIRKLEAQIAEMFPGEYLQVIRRDKKGRLSEYPKDDNRPLFPK